MSDKPSPKPSAGKSAGSGAKGASGKFRAFSDDDTSLDFLDRPQSRGELGRLAHYRVLKVLGRGGMGIVFMAEDTRLHRVVALKVMLPSMAKKAVARDRFLREARAAAAIDHDHIVTIYQVSEPAEPVPYLAMQFLKGMTLEDWLKAGKTLNIPQIMRIGKEIAKALAAAHASKLIHRDIKPSNIWLDAANKGRVKLLDFGLARPTNEETHLTQEGMILGSPAYMSPEQARGADVDERCDLFSLGCVMYRLCAGRLPFGGKDAMSMLLEIASKDPNPVIFANPDLPQDLADLVHRLLAKKPNERYGSAREVVQRIQDIERAWVSKGKTVSTTPVKRTIDPRTVDVEPVLEESAITELELQASNPPAKRPQGRSWVLAALAGAMIAVLAICCCVGAFFATNHGFVELQAEDDSARQMIEDGVVLLDHQQQKHVVTLTNPLQLQAGEYRVERANTPKGLTFDPDRFNVYRTETQTIKVRYEAPKIPRPTLALLETWQDARKQQSAWANYLKLELAETNKLNMNMTLIPPGEFLMGSSAEWVEKHLREKKLPSDGYAKQVQAEMPQHRVRISQPFYLSTTEITTGQFGAFVTAEKYLTVPEVSKKGGTSFEDGKETPRDPEHKWNKPGYTWSKDYPVNNIAWKDAEMFCQWLSKKEGKIYRLPTEAEWEYACRAGTKTAWSFGEDFKLQDLRGQMVFHLPNPLGKGKIGPQTPLPVGKMKKNEFGLFDMHGNVAEMCSDYWDPNYYKVNAKDPVAIDPKGGPNRGQRVVRGGSFLSPPQNCRSAFRVGVDPTLGYVGIGFRVVCEVPMPAE